MTDNLGFEVKMDHPYEDAVELVIEALKAEGFGVLTEIDVKATLKKKLDEDFRPYIILGACNPPLAYRALSSQPDVGLMLPCNVTVEAIDSGQSLVRILDPKVMMGVGKFNDNPTLNNVAARTHQKLAKVAQKLEA